MKNQVNIVTITILIALAALFLLLHTNACSKADGKSAPPIKQIERHTSLIPGKADTVKTKRKLRGVVHAAKTTDTAQTIYHGIIDTNDVRLDFTALVSGDSSSLQIIYNGSFPESIITRTDTLLQNTIETLQADTPWYKTFEAGVASCGILLLIYALITSAF